MGSKLQHHAITFMQIIMNIVTIAVDVGGAKRRLFSSSLSRKYNTHSNRNISFVQQQHQCRFTTQTKRLLQQPKQTNNNKYHQKRYTFVAVAGATTAAVGASIYTRHIREQRLSTLVLAEDSGLLCCGSTTTSNNNESDISCYTHQKYDVRYLIESVTRAGLVGSTKSVKDELEALRQWHISRGYNGGIVLRDITRPLFSLNSLDFFDHETDDEKGKNLKHTDNNSITNEHKRNLGKAKSFDDNNIVNPDHINRRECYYLYYEIHSDGHTRQQLFCRGTTLLADVLTCLQTFFVYDEELECHVHYGFNQHANRIVDDVLPLLKVGDQSTVEVCGHSLGGAVAMLVAIKLRKRGYTVTRVTSLAGPRFCRVSVSILSCHICSLLAVCFSPSHLIF